MIKRFVIFFMMVCCLSIAAQQSPKREFRGAWMQCVNGVYLDKSPQQIREMLTEQLDMLELAGINAVFFQVRVEGDALYRSGLEPWSRYLTGTQGQAPSDGWDPLGWMVEECHERGMECHAWLNPYRAKTKGTTDLDRRHVAVRNPERVFAYGDLLIFNPALESNRIHTCLVVEDILRNYDVDGIHIDDYFYPYPEDGEEIPDEEIFMANPRGFRDIGDWRRDNVNLLIRNLHDIIREVKPLAKFGVSPFGIYRNSVNGRNNRSGSATSGLQNYDQLYADVLLWQREGLVDYTIPQIYWNVGNTVADYEVLCRWWNNYCNDRPLYIGQDIDRTVAGVDPNDSTRNQQCLKLDIQRSLSNVQGSCMWYAAALASDNGGYRSVLEQSYHRYPALQPLMKFIDAKAPKPARHPHFTSGRGRVYLEWDAPKAKKQEDMACQYVVYAFAPGEKIDTENPAKIVTVTPRSMGAGGHCEIVGERFGYTYVITTLDRLGNESKGVSVKL